MRSLAAWLAAGLLIGMSPAWADPPEGKGKDNAPGQQSNNGNNGNNGNSNGNAGNNANAAHNNAGGNGHAAAASVAMERASRAADRAATVDAVQAQRAQVHANRANDRAADRAAERASIETVSTTAERLDVRRPSVTGHTRRDPVAVGSAGSTRANVVSLIARLPAAQGQLNGKWWKHPTDTRGQGNAGAVRMQDPFGFDKDSGRIGRTRGRPFPDGTETPDDPVVTEPPVVVEEPPVVEEPAPEEPALSEPPAIEEPIIDGGLTEEVTDETATLTGVTADFSLLEDNDPAFYAWLEVWMDWYRSLPEDDPFRQQITEEEYYQQGYDHFFVRTEDTTGLVTNRWDNLDYTLSFDTADTYTVTTQLVCNQDYSSTTNVYDPVTGTWGPETTTYSAGDVLLAESQDVTIDDAGTFAYSADLPDYSTWEAGMYADLSVTITNTSTGETTTLSYDKQLYLYRCPYGVIYDKQQKKPIAGATVTVHDAATGAIIALDKGANPHQSNPQTTDATGRYDAKLQIGRQYYLTVQAPGYTEYQSPTFSERWHVVREDVALEKVQTVAQR